MVVIGWFKVVVCAPSRTVGSEPVRLIPCRQFGTPRDPEDLHDPLLDLVDRLEVIHDSRPSVRAFAVVKNDPGFSRGIRSHDLAGRMRIADRGLEIAKVLI